MVVRTSLEHGRPLGEFRIAIERGTPPNSDLPANASWLSAIPSSDRAQWRPPVDSWPRYSREEHHSAYGRPWCIGRDQIDYLVERGLSRQHRVLDVGCGSGRAAVWLVAYLDPCRYFGIDAHFPSLEALVGYEIPLHGLESHRPRLLHSATFEAERFGETFDVILAFSVFNHLRDSDAVNGLQRLRKCLSANGRFVLSHQPPSARALTESRLEVVNREDRPCKLFPGSIRWFELAPASRPAPLPDRALTAP